MLYIFQNFVATTKEAIFKKAKIRSGQHQCAKPPTCVNVNFYIAGNMANEGQIQMNEMLRRLNLPLICRREVANDGNCFFDREEFNKAWVTSLC